MYQLTWSFPQIIIAIIVIAAIIGIALIAIREFGVEIPAFVWRIFWIVVAAFCAIVAIRFLLTM